MSSEIYGCDLGPVRCPTCKEIIPGWDREYHAKECPRLKFNDDLICRSRVSNNGPLPADAFELIHDMAYDIPVRDREQYRMRAQAILTRRSEFRVPLIRRRKS